MLFFFGLCAKIGEVKGYFQWVQNLSFLPSNLWSGPFFLSVSGSILDLSWLTTNFFTLVPLLLSSLTDSSAKYRHLLVDSIRQRYGSRREAGAEAQEQTQPPFNQAFVNVVIHQRKVPRLKERTEKPRGDVAGAPEPEECADTAMKVSDLFCSEAPSDTTKVIFLFGRPGTGKTRLMHRICQKWAEGVLPQFLFTFLFEFRQLNLLKRKLTLKELLFDMFLQPEDSPDAVF